MSGVVALRFSSTVIRILFIVYRCAYFTLSFFLYLYHHSHFRLSSLHYLLSFFLSPAVLPSLSFILTLFISYPIFQSSSLYPTVLNDAMTSLMQILTFLFFFSLPFLSSLASPFFSSPLLCFQFSFSLSSYFWIA